MPSGDVTYFCKYGRYFLIGYYLSEIEKVLLLTERAKENIRLDRLNETFYFCVKDDVKHKSILSGCQVNWL